MLLVKENRRFVADLLAVGRQILDVDDSEECQVLEIDKRKFDKAVFQNRVKVLKKQSFEDKKRKEKKRPQRCYYDIFRKLIDEGKDDVLESGSTNDSRQRKQK